MEIQEVKVRDESIKYKDNHPVVYGNLSLAYTINFLKSKTLT